MLYRLVAGMYGAWPRSSRPAPRRERHPARLGAFLCRAPEHSSPTSPQSTAGPAPTQPDRRPPHADPRSPANRIGQTPARHRTHQPGHPHPARRPRTERRRRRWPLEHEKARQGHHSPPGFPRSQLRAPPTTPMVTIPPSPSAASTHPTNTAAGGGSPTSAPTAAEATSDEHETKKTSPDAAKHAADGS